MTSACSNRLRRQTAASRTLISETRAPSASEFTGRFEPGPADVDAAASAGFSVSYCFSHTCEVLVGCPCWLVPFVVIVMVLPSFDTVREPVPTTFPSEVF
jgi:hypothetical protein